MKEFLKSKANLAIENLSSICLSIPSAALCAFLGDRLLESAGSVAKRDHMNIDTPDIVWGCHPMLSLFSLLGTASTPALFIGTGRFPQVDYVLVWEE